MRIDRLSEVIFRVLPSHLTNDWVAKSLEFVKCIKGSRIFGLQAANKEVCLTSGLLGAVETRGQRSSTREFFHDLIGAARGRQSNRRFSRLLG